MQCEERVFSTRGLCAVPGGGVVVPAVTSSPHTAYPLLVLHIVYTRCLYRSATDLLSGHHYLILFCNQSLRLSRLWYYKDVCHNHYLADRKICECF